MLPVIKSEGHFQSTIFLPPNMCHFKPKPIKWDGVNAKYLHPF